MNRKLAAGLLLAGIPMAAATAGEEAYPHLALLVARAGEAHAHLMRGDVERYRQAMRVSPDFVLMDPFGGEPSGAPRSEEHWQRIGRFFNEGREARFEPISAYHSGDLAVLVAREHAHVGVGAIAPQDWSLRVTLVFRREEGEWRLLHRHADPLAKGIDVAEAARITLGPDTGQGG